MLKRRSKEFIDDSNRIGKTISNRSAASNRKQKGKKQKVQEQCTRVKKTKQKKTMQENERKEGQTNRKRGNQQPQNQKLKLDRVCRELKEGKGDGWEWR